MNPLRKLRALFRKEKLDRDMDAEMRFHLAQRTADNASDGMPPDEARYAAQRKFGGIEQIKERAREERGVSLLEDLLGDVRYGARMLGRTPAFTVAALATLALGIGASTALFTVVNAVLLQPLPFSEPDRLVSISGWLRNKTRDAGVTPADFVDYREQSRNFVQLAASISDSVAMNLTGDGDAERIKGGMVTANYFEVFGVPAALGRTFAAEEEQEGLGQVAVLSHDLWVRRFGAEPAIVGRTVRVDDQSLTVIGVMPPQFQYPAGVELWKPISFTDPPDGPMRSRQFHFLQPVSRLRPGVTLAQAQAEIDAIAQQLAALYPKTNTDWSLYLMPLQERIVGNVRRMLLVLSAAVGCVLLIACANVANLLLARAATRQKEIAVRAALGAGRGRIVRQLLAENLLLALLGGASGVVLAQWGVRLLVRFGGAFVPRVEEIAINLPVLGFALTLALLTGLLFGFAPALESTRLDLTRSLRDSGWGLAGGGRRRRLLRRLVGVEIALSVVLLVAGGLLLQSLLRLQGVAPGFDATNVLTVRVDLPNPYSEPDQKTAFFDQLHQRLTALPGVETVGMVSELPLASQSADSGFRIEGRTEEPGAEETADFRIVNHAYFRALRIPLLRGRGLTADEARNGTRVVVISEALARRFFADEDPIGQHLRVNFIGKDAFEIVGIVGDVRHRGLDRDLRPTIYIPSLGLGYSNLVLRTAIGPTSLAALVRREVADLDPNQPVANVKTMEQWLFESTAQPRLRTWLIGSFSFAALSIAIVGLYGVMAYAVTQRRHELGVRMALGAGRQQIVGLVVREGLQVALAGFGAGALAALALTHLLSDFLFGVSATDPFTFAAIAGLLTVLAAAACYFPARRASKVDPMIALRCE